MHNVCRELFASLDKAEEILSKQRYIAGDRFTEADLRLFVTLIRFDEVSNSFTGTSCLQALFLIFAEVC